MKKLGITELKQISGGNSDNRRLEDMTARFSSMGIVIKTTYEELTHPKPTPIEIMQKFVQGRPKRYHFRRPFKPFPTTCPV